MNLADAITVVMPTSVIPSHPSTAIIEETIASVRAHLPDSEIIITVDGLRPEQENMRSAYEQYVERLAALCQPLEKNILIVVFRRFSHQAQMLREILSPMPIKDIEVVQTPLMLYLEHDTPLCEDKKIEWELMAEAVFSGDVNSIRLHHYDLGHIHPEHQYLMIDKEPVTIRGVRLIRTVQWSQRAHLVKVDFYRQILAAYFSENCRTMIEDRMHDIVAHAPWDQFKLSIYSPDGHIKRSRDLNGRAEGPKFDDTYIF